MEATVAQPAVQQFDCGPYPAREAPLTRYLEVEVNTYEGGVGKKSYKHNQEERNCGT